MTLEEFGAAGNQETFCYWLERRLEQFGSIRGGSARKFGIYGRKDSGEAGDRGRGYMASEGFEWLRKYGATQDEAFAKIRSLVIQVAEAASSPALERIDNIDLGPAFKWKIAFHYQPEEPPCIAAIFKQEALRECSGCAPTIPASEQHSALIRQCPSDAGVIEFSLDRYRNWTKEREGGALVVNLTAGAINNGYIHFRAHQSIFPKDAEGEREGDGARGVPIELVLPSGTVEQTDLWRKGNQAGIRSRFGELYSALNIKPGTQLRIRPESGRRYTLSFDGDAIDDNSAEEENNVSMTMPIRHPLNQILYGPPGTGKTFLTAKMAVEICDGQAPSARDEVMRRYRELAESRRIAFVTFHQNYAYEDFVEGIRPVLAGNGGSLSYELRKGVLKDIADRARVPAQSRNPAGDPKSFRGRRVFKCSLGNYQDDDQAFYEDCLEHNYIALGFGGATDFSHADSLEKVRRQYPVGAGETADGYGPTAVNTLRNELKEGDLVVVSAGNLRFRAIGEVAGPYQFSEENPYGFHQTLPVRWLWDSEEPRDIAEIYEARFSQMTLYRWADRKIKWDAFLSLLSAVAVDGPVNHVLIIDEINRGNISKVFGELITLLEDDKRLGELNELKAILPYSNLPFGLPSNLYVIGTMNTADRSIALIDVALRRRFEFIEVRPEEQHVSADIGGVNVQKLLGALNQRVESLLDRDHAIGHAWLMKCQTPEDLKRTLTTKVLPLLAEWFWNDWDRIRQVLNESSEGVPESNCLVERLPGAADTGISERPRWAFKRDFSMDAIKKVYGA